jgi:hypothetical protein
VTVLADASLAPACADAGWNLQVEVTWTEPIADGAIVRVICTDSDDRERDCPGLPG